jgi:hypothetical protein
VLVQGDALAVSLVYPGQESLCGARDKHLRPRGASVHKHEALAVLSIGRHTGSAQNVPANGQDHTYAPIDENKVAALYGMHGSSCAEDNLVNSETGRRLLLKFDASTSARSPPTESTK